jgi:hypothetical protein
MGYPEHDGPGADATRAFPVFRPPGADGIRYADSGLRPDSTLPPDADAGTYPVLDRYAGYERYADDQPGQPQAAAEEHSFTRAYARPANPRQAPPSSHDQDPWSRGPRPAALPPLADLAWAQPPSADSASDRGPLGEHAQELPLAARLARLRLDRWILVGGGLAATVAVVVAFATAGGSSTATPGARTAQTATTHTVQPACVSPAPGH